MSDAASSLAALIGEYLDHLRARGYATSTLDGRRRHLAELVTWLEARAVTRPGEVTLPILELLYSTGVRRAECARLQLADIDLARGVVFVRQGKGGRDRLVPLGDRAGTWLDKYLREARPRYVTPPDAGWLWLTKRGRRLTGKRLGARVSRYVNAADIGKTGSCHLFRHTMATLMLEGGADVRHIQEILGHAELSTTALYTHPALDLRC